MSHTNITRRSAIKRTGALSAAGLALGVTQTGADEHSPAGESTPMLDALDALPEAEQLPWIMKTLYDGPRPFFEELRRTRPNAHVGGVLLVSRYADVVEVLSHPAVFSVKLYKPKMGDFMLTHDETPEHARDKAVMTAMLPASDAATVRKLVVACASDAIAGAGGALDLVNDYARLIPLRLVQDHFGLDGVSLTDLKRWSYWAQLDNFHNHSFHARPNSQEIAARAAVEKEALVAYCTSLVQRRIQELNAQPDRDDVVSRMLRCKLPASLGFDVSRLVLNSIGLLIGAVETTSHAIVHAIDELLSRPPMFAAAVAAAVNEDVDKVAEYAWEAARFRPISPFMFRTCEEEFTIAKGTDRETIVKPGTIVFALTQSAMFDDVEFDAPTEFRIGRPDYQSFLFGYGYHRCLGESVARQMIPQAIQCLLSQPNLRRAPGPAGRIDYQNGPFPESLVVQFDSPPGHSPQATPQADRSTGQ